MIMLTFDTNRLGKVLQRRFNSAWRETDGEPVRLLPQASLELMGQRVSPYTLETGMENIRNELRFRANELPEKQRLWGQSVLWWAQEFLDGTLYEIRLLNTEEQEKANTICEHLDRFAFPKADANTPLSEHGDAVLLAEAFATNTRVLITNDENIRHGVVHEWADKNAQRFEIDNPYILFIEDAFLEENYVSRGDLDYLYKVALGAFWPSEMNAPYSEVLKSFDQNMHIMTTEQTGLQGIGRTIIQGWHNDVRKNAVMDQVRASLPHKMRASESRHPTFQRQHHLMGMGER